MRYAIFSDVHANPTALEKVVADARSCGIEEFVCLGDTVGYGPLPSEAVSAVRSIAHIVLAGNHDAAVSGSFNTSDFIDIAGEAALRHRHTLSRKNLAWLRSLPTSANIAGAALVHGDLTDPGAFNYVDSEDSAAANFAATDAQIVFVGHTHVPEMFVVGASGNVHRLAPQDFVLEDGKRYIVNVGSVGYPRESGGMCLSSYVIYDTDEKAVRFRFLPFSVASVMQRGTAPARRRALPLVLAAIAAIAVVAAAATFYVRRPEARPDSASVKAQESAMRPIEEKTLVLEQGCRAVKPNLQIEGSAVQLDIAFLDGSDKAIAGGESLTVKHSCKKKFRVPSDARKAVLSIRRIREDAATRITAFAPEMLR
jgi:predicted phosphodiesterase